MIGRLFAIFGVIGLLVGCTAPPISATAPRAEILWDRWGTPHIFARDETALFRALGWAQMQRQGPLLLRLYAQARGAAAAFFGPAYVAGDQTVHLLDIPALGAQWYADQPPAFRTKIDAFVAGINEFATQQPEQVTTMQALLPVTGADVFRHWARLAARFAIEWSECNPLLPGLGSATLAQQTTDGWAVAPARTAAGHALLLTNLHWPGDDDLTVLETQMVAPGVNLTGAVLVGLPTPFAGFNDHLGWTHTLSRLDRCDLFALSATGGAPPQTAIGPVVEQNGQWLALRLAGLTNLPTDQILAQWWAMGKATDWDSFQAARPHANFFNLLYADETGKIAAFAGGNLPLRTSAVPDWSLPVAGGQASWLWEQALPAATLPQVVEPAAGWVQSSSGTPWYLTLPPLAVAAYPTYPAPATLSASPDFLREQWAMHFLTSAEPLTVTGLTAAVVSTRSALADRLLPDLMAATARTDKTTAQAAARVLAQWDRRTAADSHGAALFALWYQHWVAQTFMKLSAANPLLTGADQLMDSALFYAIPWDPQAPLTTPAGLFSTLVAVQALESAANDLQRMQLPLDAAWRDVIRQGAQQDWPGNSALGVFGSNAAPPVTNSYLVVVEFAKPVRAQSLPDQRPILRRRAEIAAYVAAHTLFTASGVQEPTPHDD